MRSRREDGEEEDEAGQNTENFPASSRFPRCLGIFELAQA